MSVDKMILLAYKSVKPKIKETACPTMSNPNRGLPELSANSYGTS